MSYRYLLKYCKGEEQKISIEAWPRLKEYATNRERRRPSFIIGTLEGSRTIMLWHHIEQSRRRYDSFKKGKYIVVSYPPEDADAINDAYRLGLAASVINDARDSETADKALRYVMNATKEEVWFWTSKLLGVVGEKSDKERLLNAILLISGAKEITNLTP